MTRICISPIFQFYFEGVKTMLASDAPFALSIKHDAHIHVDILHPHGLPFQLKKKGGAHLLMYSPTTVMQKNNKMACLYNSFFSYLWTESTRSISPPTPPHLRPTPSQSKTSSFKTPPPNLTFSSLSPLLLWPFLEVKNPKQQLLPPLGEDGSLHLQSNLHPGRWFMFLLCVVMINNLLKASHTSTQLHELWRSVIVFPFNNTYLFDHRRYSTPMVGIPEKSMRAPMMTLLPFTPAFELTVCARQAPQAANIVYCIPSLLEWRDEQ